MAYFKEAPVHLAKGVLGGLLCAGVALAAPAKKAPPAKGSQLVKLEEHKLKNGLRVILSEDHSAPTYSLCVTYNTGSRNERPGRTGFAHLFEHMMFQGSENVGKGEHMALIANNGGSMNGSTSNDQTNYYETLPANQLDLGLFLESDRMRSLAITQANLDNQRATVKEERRSSYDNQPYGRTNEAVEETAYDNFAYKHSVIGSMADLDAASVDDVQQFFRTYYAPNNAVLALVGDIDTKEVLAKVKKYFASIPRQEPPKPVDMTEPDRKEERRVKIDDKLARLTRVDMAWRLPESTSPDARALSVAAMILGGGESSRLYQRLVKEKEVASMVFAGVDSRAGPSKFQVTAMVRPGKNAEDVDGQISEEIARLVAEPVTAKELERAHASIRRSMLFPRESVLSTAVSLADNTALYNDPNRVNTEYERRLVVTAADIQKAAQKYLRTANRTVIETVPAGAARPKPAPPKAPGQN